VIRLEQNSNCVVVRRGGEQLGRNTQSLTVMLMTVNSDQPCNVTSLWVTGEVKPIKESDLLERSFTKAKGGRYGVEGEGMRGSIGEKSRET